MKSENYIKPSKRRIWFGSGLGALVGIGTGFIYDYFFSTQFTPQLPAIIVCVMLFFNYYNYLKYNYGVFGMKPLRKISFGKRLLGLMVITAFSCACTGIISGFFFGSIGVVEGAFVGGFTGAVTSGMFCAVFELWNRMFPKKGLNIWTG